MRVRLLLLSMCMISLLALHACQSEVPPTENKVTKPESETTLIEATAIDPRTPEIGTKLSEFAFNMDEDVQEEKIELYTAAGRNEKGEMLWDDGQNWLLVVVDGDQYYPLFKGYVQLGELYFDFALVGEENIPTITTYTATTSSMQLMDFSFDYEQKCFKGRDLFQSTHRNGFFTSIPNY